MNALATVPRETTDDVGGLLLQIPVDQVDVGDNVRANVDGIDELAASIKEHGLKQPIKVRPDGGRWIVVYGQRRLLAHRLAGIERIPAIVASEAYTAGSLAIEQLVENLHRVDLPPLDRARAMRAVVDAGTSQADLARELGLHPSTIANDLGLLEAPDAIRVSIEKGELSPAHAKALKGLDAAQQLEIAKRAIGDGLSAHRTEELVQSYKQNWAYQQQRAETERTQAAERKAAQDRRIEDLAKKVPLDTPLYVGGGYYGTGQIGHIAKLIRAAGFTDVHETKDTLSPRPKSGCDCTAWKVEIGYSGGLTVAKACTNKKHTTVEYEAKHAWDEISALPEGQLAVELALFVRKGFNDRYNVKLDWERLATELGVVEPAEPAPAKPASRLQQRQDAINAGVARPTPRLEDRVLVEGKPFEVLYIQYPPYATDETTVVGLVREGADRGRADRYAIPLSSLSGSSRKGWSSSAPIVSLKAFDAAHAGATEAPA